MEHKASLKQTRK